MVVTLVTNSGHSSQDTLDMVPDIHHIRTLGTQAKIHGQNTHTHGYISPGSLTTGSFGYKYPTVTLLGQLLSELQNINMKVMSLNIELCIKKSLLSICEHLTSKKHFVRIKVFVEQFKGYLNAN